MRKRTSVPAAPRQGEPFALGTTIATRRLDLAGGREVVVAIGKPRRFRGSPDYFCPYRIRGIGDARVRRAGGVDAVQALTLALRMIGADLYASGGARTRRLRWNGDLELGLPVPESIADVVPVARPQRQPATRRGRRSA